MDCAVSKPYWEQYRDSPSSREFKIHTSVSFNDETYKILGRSMSGFFLLCINDIHKRTSLWGLHLLSNGTDFVESTYSWDLIEDDIFREIDADLEVAGVFFDEYKVTDRDNPELSISIIFHKEHEFAHLSYVVQWPFRDIQNIRATKTFFNSIEEDDENSDYQWVLRIMQMVTAQRANIKTVIGIEEDFVWIKCTKREREESSELIATEEAVPAKRKRGRPPGRKDNAPRIRAQNLSSEAHATGKGTLLMILMLTRDFEQWSIDAEICSYFVMTRAYETWLGEKGIDPLYKKLYDWLSTTRDAVFDSCFFTKPYSLHFLEGAGSERRRQYEELHAAFRDWYSNGALQTFFISDIVPDKTACTDHTWFASNRYKILELGRTRLRKLKEMYFRSRNSPSHFAFVHCKDQLLAMRKELETSLQNNEERKSAEVAFRHVENTMQTAVKYGECMEQLIFVLQTLRTCRCEIVNSIPKLAVELQGSSVGNKLLHSGLASMIPNALEHIKSTSDQRLMSMFPPNISHALLDLFNQHSNYPSMTSISSSIVPHVHQPSRSSSSL